MIKQPFTYKAILLFKHSVHMLTSNHSNLFSGQYMFIWNVYILTAGVAPSACATNSSGGFNALKYLVINTAFPLTSITEVL